MESLGHMTWTPGKKSRKSFPWKGGLRVGFMVCWLCCVLALRAGLSQQSRQTGVGLFLKHRTSSLSVCSRLHHSDSPMTPPARVESTRISDPSESAWPACVCVVVSLSYITVSGKNVCVYYPGELKVRIPFTTLLNTCR